MLEDQSFQGKVVRLSLLQNSLAPNPLRSKVLTVIQTFQTGSTLHLPLLVKYCHPGLDANQMN